jgi:hypothetical protein
VKNLFRRGKAGVGKREEEEEEYKGRERERGVDKKIGGDCIFLFG